MKPLPPPPRKPTADELKREPWRIWEWRDNMAGYACLEAFHELNAARRERRSPNHLPTPSPTAAPPRLPTPAEADDMLARDLADGVRELNEKRGRSKPQSLTARQLREAIKLGTQWAEEDALLMLARKARQVELDRRRRRLVVDNTCHEGPVLLS